MAQPSPVLTRPRTAALFAPFVALGAYATAAGPSKPAGILVAAASLIGWAAVEKAVRP